MLSYQIAIASPLVALLLLGGFVIWFHYMRVKPIDILSGLTVGRLPDLPRRCQIRTENKQISWLPVRHPYV
ncbi:hypothetical protein DEA98_29385 (plasmid) [Brucella pseudogrignonensis]|nr:hypothetical protein [Brucella pseudogrignonensis]